MAQQHDSNITARCVEPVTGPNYKQRDPENVEERKYIP